MNHLCKTLMCLMLFGFLAVQGLAKRVPPRPVPPVRSNGIEYSVDSDGRTGYVLANDITSGKELWRVKLYHVHIKFWVEEDVQWIYFTNLKLAGNTLLARDEANRCYSIDLTTRKHKKQTCGNEFTSSKSQ